jgi:CDP-diglyceride synthetase
MDHHAVAAVSLSGICLDLLGGLYLAYDLLGGRHGPLRLLTRAVTYSVVFGAGYGLGLGLLFGVTAGAATGITVAIELQRSAVRKDHYPLRWEAVFSAIRGVGFGAGLYRTVGLPFAFTFGAIITLGQIFAYTRGMRPGLDYAADRRPRLTRRQLRGAIIRTFGYIATALVCSALVRRVDHAWLFAIRGGLVTGVVTAVGTLVNPLIEYHADNLPERWLGALGVGLVLCGFALQSFQYWLALLDVPVK